MFIVFSSGVCGGAYSHRVSSSNSFKLICSGNGSLTDPRTSLFNQASWSANPRTAPVSAFLSTSLTGVYDHPRHFTWVVGIRTQVLMFV